MKNLESKMVGNVQKPFRDTEPDWRYIFTAKGISGAFLSAEIRYVNMKFTTGKSEGK